MINKNEFKNIKKLTETICKNCNSYEELIEALKPYFTKLTDSSSPRADEFNKKYNVVEIANSKSKKGIIHTFEDSTKLIVDYYLYDKAPNGILVVLSQMEKWENKWIQKDIDIFAKEN